jgi:hypothetical protein
MAVEPSIVDRPILSCSLLYTVCPLDLRTSPVECYFSQIDTTLAEHRRPLNLKLEQQPRIWLYHRKKEFELARGMIKVGVAESYP